MFSPNLSNLAPAGSRPTSRQARSSTASIVSGRNAEAAELEDTTSRTMGRCQLRVQGSGPIRGIAVPRRVTETGGRGPSNQSMREITGAAPTGAAPVSCYAAPKLNPNSALLYG